VLGHPAAQHIARVLNYRVDSLQRVPHRTGGPRQIHDQSLAAYTRDAAPERRSRKVGERENPDSLGDSFGFAINHRARCLRRDVARGQAGSTGGEDKLDILGISGVC
jgi:hypothetical protein